MRSYEVLTRKVVNGTKVAPLVLAMATTLALLVGCGSSAPTTSSQSSSTNSAAAESAPEPSKKLAVGDKTATDMVEFTLTDCKFTDKVGLKSDNWLMPNNGTGGLSAGDGDTYLWLSLNAKNISKGDMSGYDVTDITVDYDSGYTYGNGTYTDGSYGWSTGKGVSQNNGLASMKALDERSYYGFIECSAEVKKNRDKPLLIRVKLPSSKGVEEVVYEYAPSEGADTSAQALATSDALKNAIEELNFVQKYAGNTNNKGSRKFADERVDAIRTSLSGIDSAYVSKNLPNTAAALPEIQGSIDTICDLLVDMGETNSDENVEQMKAMATETIARMEGLLSGELSAFN